MQRVDTATAVAEQPAQNPAGTPGYFTQGNPASGLPATVPGQDWYNNIQEELVNAILGAGLELDKTAQNQLLKAIQRYSRYAVAAGADNAYAVALTPALDAYIAGMPIVFKANHTNTGPATLNVNDLGAIAIKFTDGSALSAGAIVTGALIVVIYDGTQFQLVAGAKPGGVPFGGEIMWPVDTPLPDGFYAEQGASLARATYPEVFAVIGTTYGAVDTDHFNLPLASGTFIRIWANGSSRDPDRTSRTAVSAPGATMLAGDHVGTEQADELKRHNHEVQMCATTNPGGSYLSGHSGTDPEVIPRMRPMILEGGNETRPINTNRMMIMRCY